MIIMGGDKKKLAGIIVGKAFGPKEEDSEPKESKQEEDYEESLFYAASDLLKAIEAKDVASLKSAMKSFFEICDSMPHEEGEHI